MTLLWAAFCLYRHRQNVMQLAGMLQYGGLCYAEADGAFYDVQGQRIKLTPMQQQLLEMFFRSDAHQLTKTEICDALWPKKPDASETLYTLIRRLRPIIEEHSDLKIESDRGKSYGLTIR
jgi:DNA-binding response OmpR family regulator